LVVDDHSIFREGIESLLSRISDIELIGEAGDGAEGIALARALQPDVILMDLVMPGIDGTEATRQITAELPGMRVLILTSFITADKVFPAIKAGALGYLLKDTSSVSPIEGVSFAHTFDNAGAPSKHHTQYFEMMGHRSIYHDGWRAVCPWPGPSFAEAGAFFGVPIPAEKLTELDATAWELYHVAEDFAENHDLTPQHLGLVQEAEEVAANRAKLIEMIGQWYVEAGKYNVLPVDGRGTLRFAEERPQIAKDRNRYTFYPGTQPVPFNAGPRLLNRTHSITAEVDIPEGGAEGCLVSFGGVDGGYSLYMQEGKLQYVQNYVALEYLHVVASEPVTAGRHSLRFEFEATGGPDFANGKGSPGLGQLYIDGVLVGQTEFAHTTPLSLGLTGGIKVGADPGSPVAPFYETPFEFTGTIYSVTFDLSGEVIEDDELALKAILAKQ
jgi:arylsulfatase